MMAKRRKKKKDTPTQDGRKEGGRVKSKREKNERVPWRDAPQVPQVPQVLALQPSGSGGVWWFRLAVAGPCLSCSCRALLALTKKRDFACFFSSIPSIYGWSFMRERHSGLPRSPIPPPHPFPIILKTYLLSPDPGSASLDSDPAS